MPANPPPESHARSDTDMTVTFRVNGREVTVEAPPEMPLLWVLRDVLDLKGTKFGCGMAQCGACTVHLNGQATRSCVLPVSAVAGAAVTTIEGLSADGSHPLQRAWQELDVPQCGYCQAGQLMSAAALLARVPQPTDEEIDAVMNGNICRCAAYSRIRAGIHRAATLLAAADASAANGGAPSRAPATGSGDDVAPDNIPSARSARSS